MKLKEGDKFLVTDPDKTYLGGMIRLHDVFVVTRTGFAPVQDYNEEGIPCVFFRLKRKSDEFYARLDCIRKLTKLELALK